MTDLVLFDVEASSAQPVVKISAGRRLTQRQHADVARGVHPLTRGPVHKESTRTCGNCRFRSSGNPGNGRDYPKCVWRPSDAGAFPRVTGGAATDVRAWWPACLTHEWR